MTSQVEGTSPSTPQPPRRSSSAARKRSAPSAKPCSTGGLTNFWVPSRSRPRQLPQEVMGFLRPPPACLTSEHHHTGPTLLAREFRTPEFFGSPRLVRRSSVTSNTLPSWSTVCSDNTDHSSVDRELSAMEKWEQEVQILYPDVLGDSSTCFSANSGSVETHGDPTASAQALR